MTKKEWDPFREARQHLNKYSYFFDRKELEKSSSEHPQVLEDFMDENCSQNYCYVWIRKGLGESDIVGDLIGVPKDVALAIKLIYGLDLIDISRYKIANSCYGNNPFVIYT